MEEGKIIQDISAESMLVGSIYNKPEILEEYMNLISPEWDFSDSSLRVLYNLYVKTFMEQTTVNETSINLSLLKATEEDQKVYKSVGGFKAYQRLGNVASVQDDFQKIYGKVKAFNELRYLDEAGFAVRKNFEKLKDKNVDQILKAFEFQLTKAHSFIQGINDGTRIGDDIEEFYENLKLTPDEGINIGFPIVNSLIRGWRKKTVGAICLNSGHGKSRTTAWILCKLAIVDQIPIAIFINEMNTEEMNAIILVTIANMVFSEKYGGITVTEDEITLGTLTGTVKDKMVSEAAAYIKERSKLICYEAEIWDIDTLKMLMRKFQLRDKVNYFVLDTCKPYYDKNKGSHGAEWQDFSQTVQSLKEYARQMNLGIILTLQLVDSVLQTGELTSNSLSSSKHVYHHCDWMLMAREIKYKEKEKLRIRFEQPGNPFNGQLQEMDAKKSFYVYKLAKNRAGRSGVNIIMHADKGRMIYEEYGYLAYKEK